jgi:hypothetical protein
VVAPLLGAAQAPDWSERPQTSSVLGVSQVAVVSDAPVMIRSRADVAMRRLLFVPPGPSTVGDEAVHRMFSFSIVLSGLRCLLSYVVFPVLTPALGLAAGVGPVVGIPIAVLALTFDVIGIRRFWVNDHHLRWPMTFVYAAVMILVSALLIGDIIHVAS